VLTCIDKTRIRVAGAEMMHSAIMSVDFTEIELPMTPQVRESWCAVLGLVLSLALAFAVAGIGAAVTAPSIAGWYAGLNRPGFAPPNWLFAPVWSLLYGMMGLAAWLVWRQQRRNPPGARHALWLYGAQLLLNLLWSILFFGLHGIALALADILLLLAAIGLTIRAFGRVSPAAGWILLPYFLWVGFACLLNAGFWYLN
jgi:benzodiazapine receptor